MSIFKKKKKAVAVVPKYSFSFDIRTRFANNEKTILGTVNITTNKPTSNCFGFDIEKWVLSFSSIEDIAEIREALLDLALKMQQAQ